MYLAHPHASSFQPPPSSRSHSSLRSAFLAFRPSQAFMSRLRRDTNARDGPLPNGLSIGGSSSAPPSPLPPSGLPARPLRILAAGTLFVTHTLGLSAFPEEGSNTARAQTVEMARGGHAPNVLSVLAQFKARGLVDAILVAPLGSATEEARAITAGLEREGVSVRFCKYWEGAGVPVAWVWRSKESDSQTVINHNPLPDISHEDFVSLVGPILAPENYGFGYPSPTPNSAHLYPSQTLHPSSHPATPTGNPSGRSSPTGYPFPPVMLPNSPAPLDWLHFEGRSVKTTLTNMMSIDGLARDRKWRSHCVFSLELGRKGRQGVEALIPHADVLFFTKQYASSLSEEYTAPRPFLLSMAAAAAPHALLVVQWGSSGAALLSLPTREYLQASPWVDERANSRSDNGNATRTPRAHQTHNEFGYFGVPDDNEAVESVRSGSRFYAGEHESRTTAWSESDATSPQRTTHDEPLTPTSPHDQSRTNRDRHPPGQEGEDENEVREEASVQDAFVAGMIYALSRRILPGEPFTPANKASIPHANGGGSGTRSKPSTPTIFDLRWRLDDCLRFASEVAGRRARGLKARGPSASIPSSSPSPVAGGGGSREDLCGEMVRAGWFD